MKYLLVVMSYLYFISAPKYCLCDFIIAVRSQHCQRNWINSRWICGRYNSFIRRFTTVTQDKIINNIEHRTVNRNLLSRTTWLSQKEKSKKSKTSTDTQRKKEDPRQVCRCAYTDLQLVIYSKQPVLSFEWTAHMDDYKAPIILDLLLLHWWFCSVLCWAGCKDEAKERKSNTLLLATDHRRSTTQHLLS